MIGAEALKRRGIYTSAEFKTLREGLGLSVQALAEILEVKNERTIRGWESGKPIPAPACASLRNLNRLADEIAIQARNALAGFPDVDVAVVLRFETLEDFQRYHPELGTFPHAHRVHAAAIGRFMRQSEMNGVEIRIVSMDPEAYESWRFREGAEDFEETRARWAAGTLQAQGDEE